MANNAASGSARQPVDPDLEENPFLSTNLTFPTLPDLPPANPADLAALINRNTMESNARVHQEVKNIEGQLASVRYQRRVEQASYADFVKCAQEFNDTIPPQLKTPQMVAAVRNLLSANEHYRSQAAMLNPRFNQLERQVPRFPLGQSTTPQLTRQLAPQLANQVRSTTSTPNLRAQFAQVFSDPGHHGNRSQTQSQQHPYFPMLSPVPTLKRKSSQDLVSGYSSQLPPANVRAQNALAAPNLVRRPSEYLASGYSTQAPVSGYQLPAAAMSTSSNSPFEENISSMFTSLPSTAEPKYQSEMKAIKATLEYLNIKRPRKTQSLEDALALLENNIDSFGEFVVKYLKGRHKYLTTRLRPAIDAAVGGLFDDEGDAAIMIDNITKIVREKVKYRQEEADGIADDILNPIAATLRAILAILEEEK